MQIYIYLLLLPIFFTQKPSKLTITPTMGWMSWEVFRCQIDCEKFPNSCINEQLFMQMSDALEAGGYLQVGYKTISIDDCWHYHDGRIDGKLVPDPLRFPNGMKALGDYMHKKGINFGIYSDEGYKTCGGYPGSKGFEKVDVETFKSWGVDYLKLDGCYNEQKAFKEGYYTMGRELQESGRDIVYSCSWPAYLGDDESQKDYQAVIDAGCNSWRNWNDIQDNYDSLSQIIEHFGYYSKVLQKYGGPFHWNDMDMLLIGNDGLNVQESQLQMAIWSIMASPLIMGNDLRNISDEFKQILLNKEVIAVNQDPLGVPGLRLIDGDNQVWQRKLSDGSQAVVLYSKQGNQNFTLEYSILGYSIDDKILMRDLFQQKDLGTFIKTYSVSLQAHSVQMLKINKISQLNQ